jgi:hypothetical protein
MHTHLPLAGHTVWVILLSLGAIGMARFVPAVGDIAGKIGNLVFSRGRYGPTIRRRAVPVNTRTTAQRATRGMMSAASSYWRQIICPAGNDVRWNAFAANFPIHQGKGNKTAVTVTGQAFSVAINALRARCGLVHTPYAPDTWGTDQPTGVTAATLTGVSMIISAIAGVTLDATHGVLVKATGPLPKGVRFIGKSKYRFVTFIPPTASLPLDVTAAYCGVFGGLSPQGTVIGLSVQVVKVLTATGITGVPTCCPGQPVFARMVCA